MKWHVGMTVLLSVVIGAVSAQTYAGSWNDGSRFATIESLVDRHTWVIDDSIFLTARPYGPTTDQVPNGTFDRLFIDGHYYSDKSPVPAVLLAGPYWLWHTCGGPSAGDRPDLFCWLITCCSSGVALVVFTWFIVLESPHVAARGLFALVFCCSTLALPYCRFVNNHEILLGVTAALLLALKSNRLTVAGLLSGLAFATDLGAGPIITLCTGLYVLSIRNFWWIVAFSASAMPFIALHHALNYYIGGTLGPANANSEYFNWPGCPFLADNISGGWHHASPIAFVGYALDLLVGKKGFYGHNPALLIVVPAVPLALRSALGRLCLSWLVGVWLVYAAGSTNYSGECVSVRWFVPMIAPAAFLVFAYLRKHPDAWRPFCWLMACGAIINLLAWRAGPWYGRLLPGYWFVYAAAVIGAMLLRPKPQVLPPAVLSRAA